MKRILMPLFAVLVALPVQAAVVGVVVEFAGDVCYVKAGQTLERKVRKDLGLRDTDTLVLKSGAVSVLALSGKVLQYTKPGRYQISAAGSVVTYDDLLQHNSSVRRTSTDFGATRTRGDGNKDGGDDKEQPLFRLDSPGGALLDGAVVFAWTVAAGKTAQVKELAVYDGDKVLWKKTFAAHPGASFSADVPGLKAGQRYRCEATWLADGKEQAESVLFSLLADEQRGKLLARLKAIDGLQTEPFARHYLKSVVLSSFDVLGAAAAEYNRARQLNPKL